MMIDEQVGEALAAEVGASDGEASAAAWARIRAAGALHRRRRQRRSAGAVVAAVAVAGAIVAVGVTQGPPPSEKVSTSPSTVAPTPATTRLIAPPPAPSVAEPLWQATSMRPGFAAAPTSNAGYPSAARTAGDGHDLVIATSGCHDRYGVVVQDLGDRVSVELAEGAGAHLQCLMNEWLRIRLPHPLDGRPLVDGSTGAAVPVLDGSTLLVPHELPAGLRFQSEGSYAVSDPASAGPPGSMPVDWQACYQAEPAPPGPGGKGATTAADRCEFTGDRPLVTTAQSHVVDTVLDAGILAQDSIHSTYSNGFCDCLVYASGASSPQPGRALVRTPVSGGVDGHPADLVSTGLHDVVVWTDGTNWFAVATPHGAGGLTPAELVRVAQSMRPVG